MSKKNYYENGGIKSKARKEKYGEVFTPDWLVKKMCDLLELENKDAFEVLTMTFLDPAVGTGNFPAEILRRKLKICEIPFDGAVAISTLYGIDIQEDNILECRERLKQMFVDRFGPAPKAIDMLLERNFVAGNFLTKKLNNGEPIWFLMDEESNG